MRRACIKDGLQDWLMSVKFNHIKSFKVINESITTKYAFKVRKIITGEGEICKPRGKFMHVPRMDFKIRN